MATKKKMLEAAAGSAGGGGSALDITDLFSTYLYKGNGDPNTSNTQTITNGIDLDGEGGLVWIKKRTQATAPGAAGHYLFDTERGSGDPWKYIRTDSTAAQASDNDTVTSFNSNGFSIGSKWWINGNNEDIVSWTFRKAPKFFDVVTWTGDGTGTRAISHTLDTTVGMLLVKRTNDTEDWTGYHRGVNGGVTPQNYKILINSTAAAASSAHWASTAPTTTTFTVSQYHNVSGATYVAYVFAHNNSDGEFGPDGDQDIISCGSLVSGTVQDINLGWEPQFILHKNSSGTGGWSLFDAMRGMTTDGTGTYLQANNSNAEGTAGSQPSPLANGFRWNYTGNSGSTFIYMAIRRGPLAQPEAGTEVFASYIAGQGASDPALVSGFVTDFATRMYRGGGIEQMLASRLQGGKYLETSNTAVEQSAGLDWDYQTGWYDGLGNSLFMSHMWKRAPSFCDVVCYTGDAVVGRTVSHNLGVAPEMIWVKRRNTTDSWAVFLPSLLGNTKALVLDQTLATFTYDGFNDTDPSDTAFTLGSDGSVNASGSTYIAYLFATLAGVSKISSYTGNGSSQTINAGFTSGARFILIKRTDSTGDWYVWDTARGIVAGNDPHLSLNTTAAEVSDDSIDPDNSGFIVNQVAATNINVSSATYIYYSVA